MEQGIDYTFEVLDRPQFSNLKILLHQGQVLRTESGTMFYIDPAIQIETKKAANGFFSSLKRKFAGETFFANYYTAQQEGLIGVAPPFVGDIMYLPLALHEGWILFSGAYLASSPHLAQETRFQGLKRGVLGGEHLAVLIVSAQQQPGDLFISSYGSFVNVDIPAGQHYIVDTGHLVAIQPAIQYDIRRVGSWKSTILSGEGFVIDLTGPGRVILQTRSPRELGHWLMRYMPRPSGG